VTVLLTAESTYKDQIRVNPCTARRNDCV